MKLRILALVVDEFGGAGGISQYNRDLISAWSELEAIKQIVVLSRLPAASTMPAPEKVIECPPVNSALMYAVRAIIQSVRRRRFDVIFCGHLHMMPLAVIVSKLSGAPIWLQLHGLEAWGKRSGYFRWCVEKAAIVTAVSRHTRRMFLRWANVDASKVLVLPNTVGEQFSPNGDRAAAKRAFGLDGRTVLLTVSRLAKSERYKGHERIIKILPEIAGRFDGLAYVIAGDGDLRSELEAVVRLGGLEKVVVFAGPVDRKILPTLYRAADVFVMPSSGEGFGIVYLEALACGIPVIAGDADGARDPLQDGRLGVLVGKNELASELHRLLTLSGSIESRDARERASYDAAHRYFGREVFRRLVSTITARVGSQAAR